MMTVLSNPFFYLAAVPAVIITGISKGGFAGGLGVVAVPMMALVIPAPQAAAIMLPILCTMDLFGWWAYRNDGDRGLMLRLVPGALLGIGIGWLLFRHLNEHWFELLIGVVALGFAVQRLAGWATARTSPVPEPVRAGFWSSLSGFTSFIAHAGGPPIMIYLLPKQLDKTRLVATLTLLFAMINYTKLLPYAQLGQLDATNLGTALLLAPLAPLGVYLGTWMHQRVSEALFYRLSYYFLLATGAKLLWDGLKHLI